jgi:hypothetical protein
MKLARVATAYLADGASLELTTARQLRATNPNQDFTALSEPVAHLMLGRAGACVGSPSVPRVIGAMCLYALGRRAEAEAKMQEAVAARNSGRRDYGMEFMPTYHLRAGREDVSIAWFDRILRRSPIQIVQVEGHSLTRRRDRGPSAGYWAALRQSHAAAWARVERGSQRAALA